MTREDAGLPYWLTHPTVISEETGDAVHKKDTGSASSNESVFAQKVLDALGLERLFPVQAAVHSRLRSPDCGDLCVMAATGSGKTLAYAIPIVETLCQRQVRRLRALILVPTRDLVRQVESVMQSVVEVSGTELVCGQDYLVTTPGKLLDLLSGTGAGNAGANASAGTENAGANASTGTGNAGANVSTGPSAGTGNAGANASAGPSAGANASTGPSTGTGQPGASTEPGSSTHYSSRANAVSLRHLRFLVIDEADRLLDQTWQDWCKVLMGRLQSDRQSVCNASFDSLPWKGSLKKLLFSATITKNPAKLAPLQLERPMLLSVTAASLTTPSRLREAFLLIRDEEHKLPVLFDLLEGHVPASVTRVLIFVRAVKSVTRLSRLLAAVLPTWETFAFHGALSAERRSETLGGFERASRRSVLVASDAAARGLDLRGLTLVISYDCPSSVAAYVHRCGRVARAGAVGYAVTFATVSEKQSFADDVLVRSLNRRICAAPYDAIGANDSVLEELDEIVAAERTEMAMCRGVHRSANVAGNAVDSGAESDISDDSAHLSSPAAAVAPAMSHSSTQTTQLLRKTVYKIVPPEDAIYEHWQPSLQEALNVL
jgi:ATP-dependent RNA helicase DDX51/DBP6